MDALLDNPLALGAAAAVVLLGLAALRRRGAAGKAEEIPGLDALIAAGKYDDAATLALEHQRPRVAIELLLRGQRVARAAGIAAREGDLRLAGELYDRAEDFERAAQCYERAGMNGPAQESRAKLPAAVPKQPAPAAPAPARSSAPAALALPATPSTGASCTTLSRRGWAGVLATACSAAWPTCRCGCSRR